MKLNFLLGATAHGPMILNRNDYHGRPEALYGVGYDLLSRGSFAADEVRLGKEILSFQRNWKGSGVVAIDCGANIGVHTIDWARHMEGWGSITAFEAQERVFYALCGNIVLNNCANARAHWSAVGGAHGTIEVPLLDYGVPGSFGSLELRQSERNENIGQSVDYAKTQGVPLVPLDSLFPGRVDFLKIDVEGMELEVLQGAQGLIAREKPTILYEVLKCPAQPLADLLEGAGYALHKMRINVLAIHKDTPMKLNQA